MGGKLFKILVCLTIFLMISYSATAAIYVQIPGIEGESEDLDHEDWITLESIEWGTHKPGNFGTGRSRRRGGVHIQDVTVTKEMDSSSPQIVQPVCDGKAYDEVKIDLCKEIDEGGHCYMKYTLKNVIISSYSMGGDASDIPIEEVKFNFKEFEMEYVPEFRGETVPSSAACTA